MTKASLVGVCELVFFNGCTDAEQLNRVGLVLGWHGAAPHWDHWVLLLQILGRRKRHILWTCREDERLCSVIQSVQLWRLTWPTVTIGCLLQPIGRPPLIRAFPVFFYVWRPPWVPEPIFEEQIESFHLDTNPSSRCTENLPTGLPVPPPELHSLGLHTSTCFSRC